MKKIICLFIGSIILTANGCSQPPAERDNISFKTSVNEVEDSIKKMNALMKKLPQSGEMINYFFDNENRLYVNNVRIGRINSFNSDSISAFTKMDLQEKKSFITIALFLRENEISGNHYDRLFNTWRYGYKLTADNSFRMYRNIFLKEPGVPLDDIKQAHTILDEKGDLILIKAK